MLYPLHHQPHRESNAVQHSPVAHNFRDWQRASSEAFVPLKTHAIHGGAFTAKLASYQHAEASAIRIDASAHAVERTPELISSGGAGYMKFTLQQTGHSYLIQGGRELDLTAGRLAVYDTSEPYTLVVDDDATMLVLMIPYAGLNAPVRQLTAMPLGEDGGMSDAVAPLLSSLSTRIASQNPRGLETLCTHALGLVDAMCLDDAARLWGTHNELNPNRVLEQVRATIEQRLGDPELTPAAIAEVHFMSLRQLYTVFEPIGMPVAAWIRARRLTEARRELVDPSHATQPVAQIGARWGFVDATHFSRTFKAEFGFSPSQARAQSQAGDRGLLAAAS